MGWHAPAGRSVGKPLVPAGAFVEALDLQPGEWVEIKSVDEILKTLDADGKFRGLAFLTGMRAYCGRQFQVHKRVERIFLEESKQIRRMKNTVLLRGVACEGVGIGCDRSCYFYWREAWLRRTAAPCSSVSESQTLLAENMSGANQPL
jgi:hypothetical protein